MCGQYDTPWRSFYSILQNQPQPREMKVVLPAVQGRYYFWGSVHDWLIAVELPYGPRAGCFNISLLNPFSGAHVRLPQSLGFYHKLVLSASSPLDPSCIYLLLGSHSDQEFALWIPSLSLGGEGGSSSSSSSSWCQCQCDLTLQEQDEYIPWACDAVFLNGSFYILGQDCNIRVLDAHHARHRIQNNPQDSYFVTLHTRHYQLQILPADDYPNARTRPPRRVLPDDDDVNNLVEYDNDDDDYILTSRNLVVSRGNILMVCRFFRPVDKEEDTTECFEAKVYKLEVEHKAWVRVDDLEGQVLFIGINCSKSYPLKDVGGCPNCIYFTPDGTWFGVPPSDWDETLNPNPADNKSKSGDWSVYELGSGTSSTKTKFSYIIERRPSPIWLTAPLRCHF